MVTADAGRVALDADVLGRYSRLSLYNSPYPAHGRGCAVDLYPDGAAGAGATEGATDAGGGESATSTRAGERAEHAPSPVAGEVTETRTVRCPSKPYAADHDHLVVVDTGEWLARVLHVEPRVEPGDSVAVGDDLGRLVRSGFFAPWVDNHLHVGFRARDSDPVRASGSLPLELDADVEPVAWDGAGTVVETGDTYALLDAPEHPAPGDGIAGVAVDDGGAEGATDDGAVLDGGLPHYDGGGAMAAVRDRRVAADGDAGGPVSLLGTRVGDLADGRTVAWRDVTVTANGDPVRGLSLWLGVDRLGCKVVAPGHDFAVGDRIVVGVA